METFGNNLQNDSEIFGRTIRVNLAKPQRIKEGSTRPVWSEDTWLQQHAGETLKNKMDSNNDAEEGSTEMKVMKYNRYVILPVLCAEWFQNATIESAIINKTFF